MVIVLGAVGFFLLLYGAASAIREHGNGRENRATAYGVIALFGLGFIAAPVIFKIRVETPAAAAAVAAAPPQPAASVDPRGTPEEQAAFIEMGRKAVRLMLKDPYSAKFEYESIRISNGTKVVCGAVNAKGGFGSYTGLKRYVSLGHFGGAAVDDGEYQFGNTWRRFCDR